MNTGLTATPVVFGASLAVANATALAALDVSGMTVGTMCYVTSLAAPFTLAVSSASLVTNQVVAVNGVTGIRWIIQNVGEYHLDCDLATTGDKGVIIPAQVGRTFIASRMSQFVTAVTGTASGTSPAVSVGVSTAFTNVIGATNVQSVASINAGPGTTASVSIPGNGTVPLVSNTDLHVACTTQVTGATALIARISIFGYWTSF